MHEYCLNLVCPINVEEALLDALLESDGVDIFSSVQINSHGVPARRLSAQDQVLGRSRSVQLQVLLDEVVMTRLLERIGTQFVGAGIRYWATPVAFEGELK